LKFLLDTHTFIWFVNGDRRLSTKAKKEILKSSNKKFISMASIWEMAIKVSLGKLRINYPFKEVFNQIEENGFETLSIIFDHTLLLSQLEFHHRDPFDRLLIAQAISENMKIISKDENFQKYQVKMVW
jgi:PIN domain nuclease of toxin-antitoxin system